LATNGESGEKGSPELALLQKLSALFTTQNYARQIIIAMTGRLDVTFVTGLV
jgi:hypothetical protein